MRKKTTNKKEPVQQDASDQTKPWNKQFEDDRDDDGNLSRVATRKKKRGGSILAIVVWVALALVIIIPVTWQALRNNSANSSNYPNDKITVTSTSKKKPSRIRRAKNLKVPRNLVAQRLANHQVPVRLVCHPAVRRLPVLAFQAAVLAFQAAVQVFLRVQAAARPLALTPSKPGTTCIALRSTTA